ncbi:MAG: Mercuric transport protein, MerT / Periplasmic mercury(+2) binding protein, MerP [Cytophagales bacterium]|jgi:copper chaperone CopZ|nr:mercuric transport protein MerTP [Bacteroidota bacterium]MBS1950720.1 mercuric transport protein MerTP [Bacteroidota bacterium]MBS1980720.1 mercuric transport protein MerTP [Bacteroidota bacterium]WHZ08057.1 MAG: Mercuric transport protein, MerT / Periplasmic mercury(+2) binding protein, MerP [Cytophagales bacterium]
MKTESQNGWMVGVVAAVAASLCCITPVLALLGGIGGIASTFSWIEPYRPYLIGATTLVFGFAWYQKLKPRKKDEIDCECETDEKPSFWQSKRFLGIITIIAALLVSFPHYAHIFYPKSPAANVVIVEKSNIQQVEFKISGMTCQSCSEHVNHALDGVPGVLEHSTSYEHGTSLVKFDVSKASKAKLVEAVNSTGYTVTETKIIEN